MMVWQKLILTTESAMVGQLETCLNEEGAVAVTLEDAALNESGNPAGSADVPGPGENGPGRKPDDPGKSLYETTPAQMSVWSELRLTGLFDSRVDIQAVIRRLESKCQRELKFQVEELQDQIWETVWQENFKPMRFGEKLWVCPSWCDPPQPAAVNLIIDPGQAFGTGTHQTTALCLEWLEKQNLSGKTVVDFGCGSGILAIAALLLGTEQVIAIDNDPMAIAETQGNRRKNNLDESKLRVIPADQLPSIQADIVVANILARPLIELAAVIVSLTKPAGSVLLSGILSDQTDEVCRAYETELDIVGIQTRDGWICVHGQRRA
jgi:ribosomal protein L11 methyltransferase